MLAFSIFLNLLFSSLVQLGCFPFVSFYIPSTFFSFLFRLTVRFSLLFPQRAHFFLVLLVFYSLLFLLRLLKYNFSRFFPSTWSSLPCIVAGFLGFHLLHLLSPSLVTSPLLLEVLWTPLSLLSSPRPYSCRSPRRITLGIDVRSGRFQERTGPVPAVSPSSL